MKKVSIAVLVLFSIITLAASMGSGVDPCVSSTCSEYATCTSDSDGYECECMTGFEGNGVNCSDVDECAGGELCQSENRLYCNNTFGSYNCTCVDGYFYSYAADDCVEIDSDEPYRAPALEVPGCNEYVNMLLRNHFREVVQLFLREYIQNTGPYYSSG